MNTLCQFFPGADMPIIYNDSCSDDNYSEDTSQEDGTYKFSSEAIESPNSTPDDLNETTRSEPCFSSTVTRRNNVRTEVRPHSFVGSQINRLQSGAINTAPARPVSVAELPQVKYNLSGLPTNRRGQVHIPPQFMQDQQVQQSSPKSLHPSGVPRYFKSLNTNTSLVGFQKSNSEVPNLWQMSCNQSNFSSNKLNSATNTLQSNAHDTFYSNKSPNFFSGTSTPRRSPMMNYNVGNMNPRHIDIESSWNQDKEATKSSLRNTLSPNSTYFNSQNQDFTNNNEISPTNDPYWNEVLASKENTNTSTSMCNGNIEGARPGGFLAIPDARMQAPLSIQVDPVSFFFFILN